MYIFFFKPLYQLAKLDFLGFSKEVSECSLQAGYHEEGSLNYKVTAMSNTLRHDRLQFLPQTRLSSSVDTTRTNRMIMINLKY